ncbi:hypothetical protein RHK23_16225 [Clostridioides difficile]|nr:hypothetical protein [Clostridioides difficile]
MAALKSFEKPLTPEEEIEYLTKFKIENDKSAKDTLIERNMRLVAYIAIYQGHMYLESKKKLLKN